MGTVCALVEVYRSPVVRGPNNTRRIDSGRGIAGFLRSTVTRLAPNAGHTAAVALGTGLTVLLATRIGMPVSTTHGLVGALVGAGLAGGFADQSGAAWRQLFVPLLLSPPLAVFVTVAVYPLFR